MKLGTSPGHIRAFKDPAPIEFQLRPRSDILLVSRVYGRGKGSLGAALSRILETHLGSSADAFQSPIKNWAYHYEGSYLTQSIPV